MVDLSHAEPPDPNQTLRHVDGEAVTTSLAAVVETSRRVASTPARREKLEHLVACLAQAHPDELVPLVAFLSGELVQRQIGVRWAKLRELPPASTNTSLTIMQVADAFAALGDVSGVGSQAERALLVGGLFALATTDEQMYLRRLIGGELRQGAQTGLMLDAVARAFSVPLPAVRRAHMLSGDLGYVATLARTEGAAGLARVGLEVGRPVHPMLAQSDAELGDALERAGDAAIEWKLDGIRVQIHRSGRDVAVFTRTLDDITDRVPEVVAATLSLAVDRVVLDGEAIALRPDGRPERFQVTASRVGASRRGVDGPPLSTCIFDALHVDGQDLIDEPGDVRDATLRDAVPAELVVPRVARPTRAEADAFVTDALARGHEGVMVKSLAATYEAGRRGAGWIKVKPVHVLDLVVLAAEWGHGRRNGWLSNLHLGARDAVSGQFVMLGKTFKGLTDAMLAWQTDHLRSLETGSDGHVVHVRPELVVEIAFDGVQTSRRYPAGMALRFARVRRHRPDKPAVEADTLDAVRAIYDPSL